jgi:hypothetical protein
MCEIFSEVYIVYKNDHISISFSMQCSVLVPGVSASLSFTNSNAGTFCLHLRSTGREEKGGS